MIRNLQKILELEMVPNDDETKEQEEIGRLGNCVDPIQNLVDQPRAERVGHHDKELEGVINPLDIEVVIQEKEICLIKSIRKMR
jgi:hypothetical protein